MPPSRGDAFSLRCSSSCPARKLALGLAVVAVAACIVLWVFLVLCITKKARARSITSRAAAFSPSRFSYTDLHLASQGVEENSQSSVYSTGNLPDGSVVVVKELPDEGVIKEPAFTSEVEGISKITHRNLLQLRGFCYEDGHAMLVYDHMPFCLRHFLFDSYGAINTLNGHTNTGFANGNISRSSVGDIGPSRPLNGSVRLRILQGVCAALVHLHERCILHRDVRAANVLLTEDLEPRLGGCGVARLNACKSGDELPPYVAPEVAYTGKATEKADVFSFGVLALEVVSGRHAVNGQFRLIEWVWMLYQSNKLMDALDPACMHDSGGSGSTLSGTSCSANMDLQWKCVLHVALLCCHPLMEARPTTRQVSMALLENIVLPLPGGMPPFPKLSSGQPLPPV